MTEQNRFSGLYTGLVNKSITRRKKMKRQTVQVIQSIPSMLYILLKNFLTFL